MNDIRKGAGLTIKPQKQRLPTGVKLPLWIVQEYTSFSGLAALNV